MRHLIMSAAIIGVSVCANPSSASSSVPEHRYTLLARSGDESGTDAPFTRIYRGFFVGDRVGIVASTEPDAGPSSPAGLWLREQDGSLTKVFAPGDPLPGDPTRTVTRVSGVAAKESQELGLWLRFTPALDPSDPEGSDEALVRVLSTGEATPIMWEGAIDPESGLRIGSAGFIAGRASGLMVVGTLGVESPVSAIWRIADPNETGNPLRLVSMTGMPVPEFGPGASFTASAFTPFPNQSSPCEAIFAREVSGVGVAVFRQSGSEREVLVARGDIAPAPMSGPLVDVSLRDVSNEGSALLYSTTASDGGFVWKLRPDATSEVMLRMGDLVYAPDGVSDYGAVDALNDIGQRMSDNGEAIARASIQGASLNHLVSESDDGSFRLVYDPGVALARAPGMHVAPRFPGPAGFYERNNAGAVLVWNEDARLLAFHPGRAGRYITEREMPFIASGVDLGVLDSCTASFCTGDGPFRALLVARFTNAESALVEVTLAPECLADANTDNAVDFADLNVVLSAFGQTGDAGFVSADVNTDGVVNFADLNAVLSVYGGSCTRERSTPPPVSSLAADPSDVPTNE